MLNPYRTLILSILLGAGSLAFASTGASAETVPPPDFASSDGDVLAVALIQLPQKNLEPAIVWDRKTHGERCLYRIGACRHFHDGYYYETPWWGLPLAIGGGIGAVDY
jgi:hypothetical protein